MRPSSSCEKSGRAYLPPITAAWQQADVSHTITEDDLPGRPWPSRMVGNESDDCCGSHSGSNLTVQCNSNVSKQTTKVGKPHHKLGSPDVWVGRKRAMPGSIRLQVFKHDTAFVPARQHALTCNSS